MKLKRNSIFAKMAILAVSSVSAHAEMIDVVATYTVTTSPFGTGVNALDGSTVGTADTTWTADNIYILKDKVFVTNGQTLTIEPGTKIYCTFNDLGPIGPDATDKFGSLTFTRGTKINAAGTADLPIVFTTTDELEFERQVDMPFAELPAVNDGDALIADKPSFNTIGRWGGVVLLGNAPISNWSAGGSNIGEATIEGFQPGSSLDGDGDLRADVIEYGGANAADDSGIMQYVSIRHGGYVYAGSSEINGLTLGGVGSATVIDHIEVFANQDDGLEIFGGTVSCNYMVMAYCSDDSFDLDQGYVATNQFWFSIQSNKTQGGTSNHDNGGEWDGITGTVTLANATNAAGLASAPTIYNATFIGSGTGALAGSNSGNNAMLVDDYFNGKLYNSVVDNYGENLIEVTSDGIGTGAKIDVRHNTVGRFGGGTPGNNLSYLDTEARAVNTFFDAAGVPINGNSNGGTNPRFMAEFRDVDLEVVLSDPRPAPSSPLWTANGATLQAGAPVATTYRGAFGSTNWAVGWTRLSEICDMQELPTGLVVDTDGDGISNDLESTSALTTLGFSESVNDVTPTNNFSSLYTTSQYTANFTAGQTSVTSNPNAFSLYNTADILDLRTTAGVTVQKVGNTASLSVPVEMSDTLGGWDPAGNMTLDVDVTAFPNKEFFRLEVQGAQ
jgi:trimeric autotransporter adhesin